MRLVPNGDCSTTEVLIHWQNLPGQEATWEEFTKLNSNFPSFHLEDKVKVWVGGNAKNWDRPPITTTYARRRKSN